MKIKEKIKKLVKKVELPIYYFSTGTGAIATYLGWKKYLTGLRYIDFDVNFLAYFLSKSETLEKAKLVGNWLKAFIPYDLSEMHIGLVYSLIGLPLVVGGGTKLLSYYLGKKKKGKYYLPLLTQILINLERQLGESFNEIPKLEIAKLGKLGEFCKDRIKLEETLVEALEENLTSRDLEKSEEKLQQTNKALGHEVGHFIMSKCLDRKLYCEAKARWLDEFFANIVGYLEGLQSCHRKDGLVLNREFRPSLINEIKKFENKDPYSEAAAVVYAHLQEQEKLWKRANELLEDVKKIRDKKTLDRKYTKWRNFAAHYRPPKEIEIPSWFYET